MTTAGLMVMVYLDYSVVTSLLDNPPKRPRAFAYYLAQLLAELPSRKNWHERRTEPCLQIG